MSPRTRAKKNMNTCIVLNLGKTFLLCVWFEIQEYWAKFDIFLSETRFSAQMSKEVYELRKIYFKKWNLVTVTDFRRFRYLIRMLHLFPIKIRDTQNKHLTCEIMFVLQLNLSSRNHFYWRFFTDENFRKCHQTSKMALTSLGGCEFSVGPRDYFAPSIQRSRVIVFRNESCTHRSWLGLPLATRIYTNTITETDGDYRSCNCKTANASLRRNANRAL